MNTPAFCNTTIAQTLTDTIDVVRRMGANAAFDGPAGIGKTFALAPYAATAAGVAMLTATAASGHAARHLFRQLCEMLRRDARGSIADMQRELFDFDQPGFVVIVDEAQNLNLQSIRELLTLNDRAHMSVVFCGNSEVIKKTRVDRGPLATIGSRIYFRRTLSGIAPEDADAIARTFNVEGDDAFGLVRGVGRAAQARGVAFVLRFAQALAGGGAPIKARHIRQALDDFPQYRPPPKRMAA